MAEHKMKTIGSYAEIWHHTAKKSVGGLTRKDLMKTKRGRIVSKKKHAAGLKAIKHLKKLGYTARKGQFVLFRKSMAHKKSTSKKRSTRKRGGAAGVPSATSGTGHLPGSK
jgi:hypothetical protein